ncbi:uncharacterized protein C12orf45 homolog [Anguilla anguilla]|uniref:uncharacterized protein C12orf45 homolog n=1 Tax=Anguilla anguilla TaxID=7936 RepID=UPI0015AE8AFF|nr:uncharacterized protein C12orf45 homolog [Anguilla anguilla]
MSKMEREQEQETTTSQELLSCGNGEGFHEKLLLKSKASSTGGSLQTSKVPRSSVLDRLQSFLPQMAQANRKLREELESAPAGRFDIECVGDIEKVIEMDVALVELQDSDSDEETASDSSSDSDSDGDGEVTEATLRLPGDGKKGKPNIEVLEREDS